MELSSETVKPEDCFVSPANNLRTRTLKQSLNRIGEVRWRRWRALLETTLADDPHLHIRKKIKAIWEQTYNMEHCMLYGALW